jgi:hypothetical protein
MNTLLNVLQVVSSAKKNNASSSSSYVLSPFERARALRSLFYLTLYSISDGAVLQCLSKNLKDPSVALDAEKFTAEKSYLESVMITSFYRCGCCDECCKKVSGGGSDGTGDVDEIELLFEGRMKMGGSRRDGSDNKQPGLLPLLSTPPCSAVTPLNGMLHALRNTPSLPSSVSGGLENNEGFISADDVRGGRVDAVWVARVSDLHTLDGVVHRSLSVLNMVELKMVCGREAVGWCGVECCVLVLLWLFSFLSC